MKQARALSLKTLQKAGQTSYKKISVKTINRIKSLFSQHLEKNPSTFQNVPPRARFLYFYIWHAYFNMLSWPSFIDILNELEITPTRKKGNRSINHPVHGGIFGITIAAIVGGIAAAASKTAAAVATTAAVIGSSTTASVIASSVAGGVGGALAGAATEAIIKNS